MARGFREEKTRNPGVTFIQGKSKATGRAEKIYYITYYRQGKRYHEKAGREGVDGMTARLANNLRAARMEGRELPNVERRAAEVRLKAEVEGRWTIDRLWREYLSQKPHLKGGNDEYRYDLYLKAPFGGKVPGELVPLDVDRLRMNLGKTLAPQTVKNVLELLRRIVNFGIKRSLCPPLAFRIILPKVNNETTEDLSPEQLGRLLKVLREGTHLHEDTRQIMLLALLTGMRRGELFRLTWGDLDFQRGFIRIRDPKGGTDQTIPMGDARAIFQGKVRGKDGEYVFPGRKGKRRTSINAHVNAIKKAAGLPPGREFRGIHGLRHVFASMLASSGEVDLYTLQKMLTHKSPLMTQRYSHLRDETMKHAASVAGKIISEA
ncbi:MAG TPA: integrase [Deltaproteobacteria bacterium]|nr:integrase [Deltaproteobacteria bacterium]